MSGSQENIIVIILLFDSGLILINYIPYHLINQTEIEQDIQFVFNNMNNQYPDPCFLETTCEYFQDLISQDYKNIEKSNQLIVFEINDQEYYKLFAFDSKTSLILYYDYLEVQDQIETVYIDFVCNFVNQIRKAYHKLELHYIDFGAAVKQHQFRFASDFLARISTIQRQVFFYVREFHQSIYPNQIVICLSPNLSVIIQLHPQFGVELRNINEYIITMIQKAQQIIMILDTFKKLQQQTQEVIRQYDISSIIMEDRDLYLNPFIINVSKLQGLEINFALVLIINYYMKQSKILRQKKKKLESTKKFAPRLKKIRDLFKEEQNCHFPKKVKNQARCQVCYHNGINPPRRTNYKCMSCNYSLCPSCFEEFHVNPTKYFGRGPNMKND